MAPATVAQTAAITEKNCGTCGHVDPIPPGIDATQVRCINVDAMWHATYNELLIRLMTTRSLMETQIASIQREMGGVDGIINGVREDAARIAKAIGD